MMQGKRLTIPWYKRALMRVVLRKKERDKIYERVARVNRINGFEEKVKVKKRRWATFWVFVGAKFKGWLFYDEPGRQVQKLEGNSVGIQAGRDVVNVSINRSTSNHPSTELLEKRKEVEERRRAELGVGGQTASSLLRLRRTTENMISRGRVSSLGLTQQLLEELKVASEEWAKNQPPRNYVKLIEMSRINVTPSFLAEVRHNGFLIMEDVLRDKVIVYEKGKEKKQKPKPPALRIIKG